MIAETESQAQPNTREPSRLLTVAEVAEALGVCTETVRRLIAAGELRGVLVSVNRRSTKPRYKVALAELHAFQLLRTAAPKQPEPKQPARRRQRKTSHVIEFF
jgi:excisionase family DNA binding protein